MQYVYEVYSSLWGYGYILLRPRDRYLKTLDGAAGDILLESLGISYMWRWGRLRLPTGQTARSVYSEGNRKSVNKRNSCNVKMYIDGQFEFGEVQFYFLHVVGDGEDETASPYALVSFYGRPDADLLEDSYHTLWACKYMGLADLRVVKVASLLSVVSMQPLPRLPGETEELWFVAEKSGLEDTELTGYVEGGGLMD
ncbi:hypothetical protein BD779DRAFT_1479590 [Infundibulicybe gibba]|nr:hypothetical protein BD779DRAFT_1479590 [Infundibulicybe gibba]